MSLSGVSLRIETISNFLFSATGFFQAPTWFVWSIPCWAEPGKAGGGYRGGRGIVENQTCIK